MVQSTARVLNDESFMVCLANLGNYFASDETRVPNDNEMCVKADGSLE